MTNAPMNADSSAAVQCTASPGLIRRASRNSYPSDVSSQVIQNLPGGGRPVTNEAGGSQSVHAAPNGTWEKCLSCDKTHPLSMPTCD